VNAAPDHHVIEFARLHEVPDLPLGNANPLSKLLWRFQPLVCLVLFGQSTHP
jgi:hypothetical protein